MGKYVATIRWRRQHADFVDGRYSRGHEWHFDGGLVAPASASPQIVKAPWSDPGGIDPEEAFVASLSSCHMLFFLSLAAKQGITVDDYVDEAEGRMRRNADGQIAMTDVVLRPLATYREPAPDAATVEALHDAAHHQCFIANSVRTEVRVEVRG